LCQFGEQIDIGQKFSKLFKNSEKKNQAEKKNHVFFFSPQKVFRFWVDVGLLSKLTQNLRKFTFCQIPQFLNINSNK